MVMAIKKQFSKIFAFSALFILASLLLWNMFSDSREHSQFLNYMEGISGTPDQHMPDTIFLSNSTYESAKHVIIKNSVVIEEILRLFHEKKLVETEEYYRNRAIAAGTNVRIKFDFGSKIIRGSFRVAGKSNVGFGFLLERNEDVHWFYGAWDPWPLKSYWINLHPYEWISVQPEDSSNVLMYEIFAFLFFAPVVGIDLHVNEGGFSYSIRDTGIRSISKEAEDLLRVGSMRKFFQIHPEFKHRYTNRE